MSDAARIKDAFAAFRSGDLAPLAELLAPDARWLHWDAGSWDCDGREAVLERLRERLAQGFAGELDELEDGPQGVYAHIRDRRFGACMVITFDGDRIAQLRDHLSPQEARIDAGLLEHVPPPPSGPPEVSDLVPFVHVADPAASATFYAHFGFTVADRHPETGRLDWCWLHSPQGADLMLARASEPVSRADQAVLFYLYSDDLAALRERLVSAGLRPSPIFDGSPGPRYELRISDPDGYVLMVAQLEDQSSTK